MTTLRRAASLAVSAALLVACASDAPERTLSGYQLDPAPSVAAFSLPDASASGSDFTFRAAEGQLLIVYFGYTSCPDVCPTTLYEVKKALQQIGESADAVNLAMITVDPDRDTDAITTGYVQSFVSQAHALRTEVPDDLQVVANAFGASYSVTKADDGAIEVSHSGALYVVDAEGSIVLIWPFGIPAAGIANDLQILLSGSTP